MAERKERAAEARVQWLTAGADRSCGHVTSEPRHLESEVHGRCESHLHGRCESHLHGRCESHLHGRCESHLHGRRVHERQTNVHPAACKAVRVAVQAAFDVVNAHLSIFGVRFLCGA